MSSETTKRCSKDSVFVDLFTNTEFVLRLYKELHPEDTDVAEVDINVLTIKSIVYAVARTAPARTSNRTLPHFEPHFDGVEPQYAVCPLTGQTAYR